MVDNKVPIEEKDRISRPTLGGDFRYGKLILLRDCIKDVETDLCQLRNIINTVCNEIYITNEKVKTLLEANQKRIDLLKDLESKISVAEYKRTSYIEELEVKPCYSILLMHEPDYVDTIDLSNYDLVLAGHSLGGISFPILGTKKLPSYATKYYDGKHEINDTILYVSNGLGTDKTKFRFMNRPSINLYRIIKGNTD